MRCRITVTLDTGLEVEVQGTRQDYAAALTPADLVDLTAARMRHELAELLKGHP